MDNSEALAFVTMALIYERSIDSDYPARALGNLNLNVSTHSKLLFNRMNENASYSATSATPSLFLKRLISFDSEEKKALFH